MEQQHKDKLNQFKNIILNYRTQLIAVQTAEKTALAAIPAETLSHEQRAIKNDQLMVFNDIFDCITDMVDDIDFLISLDE